MSRKVELTLEYQNYIESPPIQPKQLYGNACQSDTVTIESWRKIWIENIKANHKRFGSFKSHSLGQLHGINKNKPAIIVGSGPSLGYNGHELKHRSDLLAVSCLHNYHFFEDQGIHIDYFVSLDAGTIVIDELSEGGKKSPNEYWESTKNKKLCAFIGSNPKLFELWQGEIYLFNAPVPDAQFIDEMRGLEEFNIYISNGGNVLGACLYISKGVFGSNPIAYMGADFAFGYDKRFHSWDSKYDVNLGQVLRAVDVFGNKVLTWPSYWNFKNWFDYVALSVPGIYVNCSEGGTMGAYPEGNLMAIKQMPIKDFIGMYGISDILKDVCQNPEIPEKRILF